MKKRIILLIISILFIIIPFFINVYSIYRLISVCIGITLMDIVLVLRKKINIFLLVYLPIILLIFTYSIDYIKTYTFKLTPIFVFENKINDKVSIYNSLFYRIYKCSNEEYFDNNYESSFMCETNLIDEININKFLNEPLDSFKKYKNNFIKITGKISKIEGTNSITLQAYKQEDGIFNGYVKFDETSKLIIKLNGIDISKYKIYDYITVVGLISEFEKNSNVIKMIDVKLEEKDLYDDYEVHVIESLGCKGNLKEYTENYYLYCLENIYLDYKIDKYELSYALKDKKITMNELLINSEFIEEKDFKIYKLDKFNVLVCNNNKNIILNRNEKINNELCKIS